MTDQLYWHDPYQRRFQARVVESLVWEGNPAVVLDATCFYPTSGGQPHDLGTLNDIPVVDVVEADERIIHVLARPLTDQTVQGEIDWARRVDHMQQHTGQHILSRAFMDLLDADTVSFHLGEESSTIDITQEALTEKELVRVEDRANEVVVANYAVTACEHDKADVEAMHLRHAPKLSGRIRIVDVEGVDRCPCGGTHVRATGEIGLIHIRGWERRGDVARVEFLCGERALRDYRQRDRTLQTVALELSVGVDEVPEALARLQEAESEARREMRSLRTRLLDAELPRLAEAMETVDGIRLLARVLESYDAGNMRYLAQQLTDEPGRVVLLGVTDPSPQFCFARSEDVDMDMGALLREAAGPYGGRGGGRPHMAQGGGVSADDLSRVLADARARLVNA